MKICFFDDEPEIFPLQYGGKARTILNLAKEFTKYSEVDKVTILSRSIFTNEKEFVLDGITFISLNDENTLFMIKKYCDESDIINIHCCSFTFPNINCKAKKVYFLHDVLIATADRGSHLDKALGGNFDIILAPSLFAKTMYDINKIMLGVKTKCEVIPRHINTEMFDSMPKYSVDNDLSVPSQIKKICENYEKVFFFPSRPIKEKGGGYLVELTKRLDDIFDNYCIVGPFDIDCELPCNCINTGWIRSNQLKYYYSIANVTFNFSILPESFSQICIESVYCNTPVVSFKSGNIPSLNKISNSIILVDKNIDSIVDGINKALEFKENIVFMNDSKRAIEKEFNKDKIIKSYLELYKKIVGGNNEK